MGMFRYRSRMVLTRNEFDPLVPGRPVAEIHGIVRNDMRPGEFKNPLKRFGDRERYPRLTDPSVLNRIGQREP